MSRSGSGAGRLLHEFRTVYEVGPVSGLTDAELLDRFHARRDGPSFEAIVSRHGPMVLSVCQALLRDEHAAEDAFQATFLILVRKAGSVHVGDSLGRWLYGVAHRVARHARADAARRKVKESEAAGPDVHEGVPSAEQAEVRRLLHEELGRLPDRVRAPIVLCHLQGLTQEETARRLRWPLGTVRSRIARGRARLRDRLERRGVASAVGASLLDAPRIPGVPPGLALATVSAASADPTRLTALVSASVLTLSQGVITSMSLFTWKTAAVGLITLGTLATAATAVVARQEHGPPGASENRPQKTAEPSPKQTPRPDSGPDPFSTPRLSGAADPARTRPAPSPDANPFSTPSPITDRAKIARYKAALREVERAEKLSRARTMSQAEFDAVRGTLDMAKADLADLADSLRDEMEQNELRLKRASAEERRCMGQRDLAVAKTSLNQRLSTRMPGAVSAEELKAAEAQLLIAEGGLKSAEADREMIELRTRQLARRLKRLDE